MVEDIKLYKDGQMIYGKLFMPEGDGPFPAVVIGHGFSANLQSTQRYAKAFADAGIAACAFDFIGGGFGIKSDGRMTNMSVLTEAADMNIVFNSLRDMGQIDEKRMFLMGCSQGGFVATYVAAHRPADVRGLVAFYPAYVLQDDAKKRTDNGKNIKDLDSVMDIAIGRIYDEDALSFDIYDVMRDYDGPAFLIHGTADPIVPLSYSQRAAEVLSDARIMIIQDAGHGFHGADDTKAIAAAISFVKGLC